MSRYTSPGGYGVVGPEHVAELSGLEIFARMHDGRLPAPPIAKLLDMTMSDYEHGRVAFVSTPHGELYNPLGTVHGGYTAALLDSCMGCAVHSTLKAGQAYTTVELTVNYVRALTEATGEVRAEGKIISLGRQIATAEGRLTDASGKLLAHGTTTCIIFSARSAQGASQ